MALSRGDDFPIHQTSEPIAYAGTDRNFYDRYFFNGYGPEGEPFFAVAFGVYPQVNIADASFCIVQSGVQTSLHASRWLEMERMNLTVGPICITVIEPLQKLRIRVSAPEKGLEADIIFEGRTFPLEEPRFIRRIGPRAVMDYTRLTQNGRWSGWVELDGKRRSVEGFLGTRDRSWGVRPIGARDAQATVPPVEPQFYWIWAPANFETGSFFFHSNEDADGVPWNRRAAWARDGADAAGIADIAELSLTVQFKSGTRHASHAEVGVRENGQERKITYEPLFEFYMMGLGYGHPEWGHGAAHSEPLAVTREDFELAKVDVRAPQHLHVQAICKTTYEGPDGRSAQGQGVLEQLIFGRHGPSGFTGAFDFAK